jgi:ABC-2 type transport system permease protein
MKTLLDTLYMAWVIGTKDILDALKSKSSRSNIILMIGMVVFFYWLSALRPFDKNVSVVVYDEGHTSLSIDKTTLGNGAIYSFREAASIQEMEDRMANQNLGLVLPADLDQTLASGGTPALSGYIFWVDRMKVTELETRYSRDFTEIVGQPVQVVIGENIIIPQASTDGSYTSVAYLMFFFVFMTALTLIPFLMLEERQTRTMDALMTSPATPGQIVLGKALAGFFYILLVGGLWLALNWAYFVQWGMAAAAFLGYALFAIGLALVIGNFITSPRQISIWTLVFTLFLMIPALFYMESNLKAGIRAVLTWSPSAALSSLIRFSCSTGVTPAMVWPNLAIALVSIGIVFGLLVWKVRQTDR